MFIEREPGIVWTRGKDHERKKVTRLTRSLCKLFNHRPRFRRFWKRSCACGEVVLFRGQTR